MEKSNVEVDVEDKQEFWYGKVNCTEGSNKCIQNSRKAMSSEGPTFEALYSVKWYLDEFQNNGLQ